MVEPLTDEDIARLRAEGAEVRREVERRVAPMKATALSARDREWAETVAARVRLETRVAELERERNVLQRGLDDCFHDLKEAQRERDEARAARKDAEDDLRERTYERDCARDNFKYQLGRAKHAEAAAAQMRAAMQQNQSHGFLHDVPREGCPFCEALSSDAGRALLERVERYERALTDIANATSPESVLPLVARAALSEGE